MVERTASYSKEQVIFWGGFALVVLLSIALRLWNLEVPDLWTDEIFTEFRATAPLQDSLESMWAVGNQNPLYYLTLRPLNVASEFELRLPSVIMGVGGIAVLMLAARYFYTDARLALWAGLLLALSPFHVMISRTARPYPMVFLFCLLASVCFLLLAQDKEKRTRGVWLAFIVTSMIAYLTHYSAAAIGAAQMVYLALLHRQREERPFVLRWFGAQVIAALPFFIWVILIVLNLESTYEGGFDAPPSLGVVPVSLWNLLFGYDGRFNPLLLPALIAGVGGLALAVWWVVRARRSQASMLYWLLLIGLSVLTVVAFTLLISPAYQDRYFTVFVPGLMLLFVGAWLSEQIPAQLGTAALLIVTATAGYNTYDLLASGDYWRADWQSADAYISANFEQEDGLLFERDHPQQAFERYFTGDDAWLHTSLRLQETPDTSTFEAEHGRIWVVYRNPVESLHLQGAMPDFDPFDPDLNPLGAWLATRQDRLIETQAFRGVTVLLLAGS